MIVCYASKKQKSTSDYPSDLYQTKDIGVPNSTRYRCKYEYIKNEKGY